MVFDSLGPRRARRCRNPNDHIRVQPDSLAHTKTDARKYNHHNQHNSVHKPTSRTYSDSQPSVNCQYELPIAAAND